MQWAAQQRPERLKRAKMAQTDTRSFEHIEKHRNGPPSCPCGDNLQRPAKCRCQSIIKPSVGCRQDKSWSRKSNYEHRLFWLEEATRRRGPSTIMATGWRRLLHFSFFFRFSQGKLCTRPSSNYISPYSLDIPLSIWSKNRWASQTPTTYFRWKFHVTTARTAHLPLTPPWLPNAHCRTDPLFPDSTQKLTPRYFRTSLTRTRYPPHPSSPSDPPRAAASLSRSLPRR